MAPILYNTYFIAPLHTQFTTCNAHIGRGGLYYFTHYEIYIEWRAKNIRYLLLISLIVIDTKQTCSEDGTTRKQVAKLNLLLSFHSELQRNIDYVTARELLQGCWCFHWNYMIAMKMQLKAITQV